MRDRWWVLLAARTVGGVVRDVTAVLMRARTLSVLMMRTRKLGWGVAVFVVVVDVV